MRVAVWAVAGTLALGIVAAASVLVLWQTAPEPGPAQGWSLLADLPDHRGEMAGAVAGALFGDHDEEFVLIGGLSGVARTSSAVRVYDAEADVWRARVSLPEPRHHAAAAVLDDGTLIVAGGSEGARDLTPTAAVWLQDGAAWKQGPPMPEGRTAHGMVTLDGVVYVIGGQGPSARTLIYDGGSWQAGAALPESRGRLGAIVVDDEIWAVGGRNGAVTARVDIYDPRTDSWRDGPALPAPTSGAAVAVVAGTPVVVGGEGDGVIDAGWFYDGRSWQSLPRPPLAVHGAAVGVIDGRLVIAGGASRPGSLSVLSWTDAVQALDPAALR